MNDVPYIVHESAMARMERIIKRLWIALMLVIALLVCSNVAWIAYENSFEEEVITETYEANADSGVAIANGDGMVTYGNS